MPRELEQWERCARNSFSGMHIWMLDVARDETNRPIKGGGRTAVCKVCGSRPDYGYETTVVDWLLAQRAYQQEADRARRLLRETSGRRVRR